MSVINQVLNQLEQRGANTAPEQTLVRAVPPSKRNFILPLLVFSLALIAGIAAWQWVQSHKPVLNSVEGPNSITASIMHKAGNSPSPSGPEIPAPKQQSVMVETVQLNSTSSGQTSGAVDKPQSGPFVPASRLSFELSSVPRTEDRRQRPEVRRRHQKKSAAPKAQVAAQTSRGASQLKQVSPAQQADGEFRKAVALMQQGRIADALAGYEAALRLDAGHDEARQALVALLLENKRGSEAERVLQDRLKTKPEHTGFTMLLARLQVERGAVKDATATLEHTLPYAGRLADYQAFLAALLQRQNRNAEAISHYQIALQLVPNNGIWWMGYGISLQAVQRNADAKDAFKRALDTQALSPDLQEFVQQKIKEL